MKLYRNIIIIVVLIAVLGGAMYFVTKYEPNAEPETTGQSTDALINIYSAKTEDIIKIHIKNETEEYTLKLIDGKWALNGDKSIKLKQTSANSVASANALVSVKKVVAENSDNASDFGFDNPLGFARITFADGSTNEITVGAKTLDGQDYYIKVSGDEKIYLKNYYGVESLIPSSEILRDLSLFSADMSDINVITHFYMSKQGALPVELKNTSMGTEENPSYKWEMTRPVGAVINGQNFSDLVLICFESVNAVEVADDHPADLSKYGLKTPFAEAGLSTKEKAFKLKVGAKTDGGRFAMVDGENAVYVVSEDNLSFLDVSYVDLMSNLIHVEYIDKIKSVEIVSKSEKIVMDIKDGKYYIDGKEIKKADFSKAYQAIIGISLDSLDLNEVPNISPECYVKYTRTDGSVCIVNFLPVSERNYRVTVDGKGNSMTGKKNFENAVKKVKETLGSAN